MSSISKKRIIYLDNAAATPVDGKVQKEMAVRETVYGNPSSFNDAGREARKELEECRLKVARFIGAKQEEIIFTSSGSEANNLAIFGLAGAVSKPGEIITTPVEHPSIWEPLKVLENKGWKITYLKVDKEGRVSPDDFRAKLNPSVRLVSIIYANNEIGTIQPIKKIAKVISDFRKSKLVNSNSGFKNQLPITNYQLLFHIDSCQATEYLDLNVNNLGVDLMTFNGTKIYGPKGIGVLYKKTGVNIVPLVYGGKQENGLRAGTENLPAISGFTKAISLISRKEVSRVSKLRDYFFSGIKITLPEARINGALGNERLPNNINISVPGLDSENLLLELDKYGIYASSGSACTARSVEPSHVLKAIGVEPKYLTGALRFSLGRGTSLGDIKFLLAVLPKVINDLKYRYPKKR